MMPIPYAFNMLGLSLGSAMLVGVALLSYWTMAVMVQVRGPGQDEVSRTNSRSPAADSLLPPPPTNNPQGSAETGERTYASLVGRVLGPAGEALLQV
jgi:hypothetical protein